MMVGNLLLVEDSAPMRDYIRGILGSQFGVVCWVADGNAVLKSAHEMQPEIIILDISLPGVSGLRLLPLLRAQHRKASIVMLTNHDDNLYRTRAFVDGADAYVLKNRANEYLLPALRAGRKLSLSMPFVSGN